MAQLMIITLPVDTLPVGTVRLISYGQYQSPPVCVQAKLLEPSFDPFVRDNGGLRPSAPLSRRNISRTSLSGNITTQNYSSNDTIFQLIEIIFSSPR